MINSIYHIHFIPLKLCWGPFQLHHLHHVARQPIKRQQRPFAGSSECCRWSARRSFCKSATRVGRTRSVDGRTCIPCCTAIRWMVARALARRASCRQWACPWAPWSGGAWGRGEAFLRLSLPWDSWSLERSGRVQVGGRRSECICVDRQAGKLEKKFSP